MKDPKRSGVDKDSSVLFSLNELVVLEKERLDQEAAAVSAALEAAERSRRDAEARAFAAEEAARHASLARIHAEEEEKRAAEARLVGMQAAIVERARIEAQQQAKLAELQVAQAHQQALAKVQVGSMRTRLRAATVGIVTLVVLAAAGGAVLFVRAQEALRAREAAHLAETERASAEQARIAKQLEEAQRETERVKREIDAARSGHEASPSSSKGLAPHGSVPHAAPLSITPKANSSAKAACKCRPGDSICREMPDGTCSYL